MFIVCNMLCVWVCVRILCDHCVSCVGGFVFECVGVCCVVWCIL